jgi:hypothetical protein
MHPPPIFVFNGARLFHDSRQEGDDLDGFSQTHIVTKQATVTSLVLSPEKANTVPLVRPEVRVYGRRDEDSLLCIKR